MTSDFARQISIYDAALRLSSFIPGSYSCTATRAKLDMPRVKDEESEVTCLFMEYH